MYNSEIQKKVEMAFNCKESFQSKQNGLEPPWRIEFEYKIVRKREGERASDKQ